MDLEKKVRVIQTYFKVENFDKVILECKILLKKFPTNSYILNLCGLALEKKFNFSEAINYFQKSLYYDSKNVSAINNLGLIYKKIHEYENAKELFEKAIKIDPKYLMAIYNLGNLKKSLNFYNEAIDLYQKAIEIEPNNLIVRYNLATTYQGIGKFKEAYQEIKNILRVNSNFILAHKVMSELINYNNDHDNHLNNLLEIEKNQSIDEVDKIDIFFSIGKAYDEIKNFDEAFKYFEKGNLIKNKNINYSIKKDLDLMTSIKEIFNDINFENKFAKVHSDKKIIFICGMPRAGTTLVEQIISAHSKVYGAGELIYLTKYIKEIFFNRNEDFNSIKDKIIFDINNLDQNKLYESYMKILKNYKVNKEYITDKAPQNFRWIGFIKKLFPNAKIVHCKRNAKDNCLSLFKNNFASKDMDWTYSEENIYRYYNAYSSLMDFWNIKIKDSIIEINYENLVNDKEAEIKKLIKKCGLDWEENCLNYNQNSKTPIKTVSIGQARKSIYKGSVNSYKNFDVKLKDLFSNLI